MGLQPMRIYVQREGETHGPFSPEELVGQLRGEHIAIQDPAYFEGEGEWRSITDILHSVGLTPSGRRRSNKLRRPNPFVEGAVITPDPLPEAVAVEVASEPETRMETKVPTIADRPAEAPGVEPVRFNWNLIRGVGIAAPVLVLVALLLPWYTLPALIGQSAHSGLSVFSSSDWFVPAFAAFMVLVIGTGWYAFRASTGAESAGRNSILCACAAVAVLFLMRHSTKLDLDGTDLGLGLGLGGGLHLCAGALFVCSAFAWVPVQRKSATAVRLLFVTLPALAGLVLVTTGMIFLMRYSDFSVDKLIAASESPTPRALKGERLGNKELFIPAGWSVKQQDKNSIRAKQPSQLFKDDPFLDFLDWKSFPLGDANQPEIAAFAKAFEKKPFFEDYLTTVVFPEVRRAMGDRAHALEYSNVEPVTKGGYRGFQCQISGVESVPLNGEGIPVESRYYIVRSGSDVVTFYGSALAPRWEKRSRLFQRCIDLSDFE